MKIGILRCSECGSKIQRTLPFPEFLKPIVEELYRRVTSRTCPKGCNPPGESFDLDAYLEITDVGEVSVRDEDRHP